MHRPVDPAELLRQAGDLASPVLRIVLERARAGSLPGARADDHVVCLAVEGGGMRGSVSAGMCVLLEAAGLVGAFDRVYGVSAGALNGAGIAAGQAALNATRYQDASNRQVINHARPLIGRPVVDFDYLFGELISARKPLALSSPSEPEFRALATSLQTHELRVLRDFSSSDELVQAVRASAALPLVGGRPPLFRGERMVDGGLIEAIPFETAAREGATHVLVLRSRSSEYRRPPYVWMAERLALRREPQLVELARDSHDDYNRQAAELARVTRDAAAPRLAQIAVPDGTRTIGRLEASPARVVEALRAGASAMAQAILTEPIDLCWQPVTYRATPRLAEEPIERIAPAAWRLAARRAGSRP